MIASATSRKTPFVAFSAFICVDPRFSAFGVVNSYVLDNDLELLPVINKIDLPAADIDRVREEIDTDLGLDPFAAIPISATTGVGIDDVPAGIVEKSPSLSSLSSLSNGPRSRSARCHRRFGRRRTGGR